MSVLVLYKENSPNHTVDIQDQGYKTSLLKLQLWLSELVMDCHYNVGLNTFQSKYPLILSCNMDFYFVRSERA